MTPIERLEWLARNQVYTPPPLVEYPKRGRLFSSRALWLMGFVLFMAGMALLFPVIEGVMR